MTLYHEERVRGTLITNQINKTEGRDHAQTFITAAETQPSANGVGCNVGRDNSFTVSYNGAHSGAVPRFMYLTDLEPYTQYYSVSGKLMNLQIFGFLTLEDGAPSPPPPEAFEINDDLNIEAIEDEYEEESFEDLVNALDAMDLELLESHNSSDDEHNSSTTGDSSDDAS